MPLAHRALLVALVAAVGACAAGADGEDDAALVPVPTTSTTTLPTTTTATTVAQPIEPEPVADDGLRPGESGSEIVALQQRLDGLGYWLGDADGTYGRLTEQAVLAFQKAEGLARDGVAGPATLAALTAAGRPLARDPGTDGIEIDLGRQILLVVAGGEVRFAINTSTGRSGWSTPPGTYAIDREVDGLRRAPLGDLYRPKYFRGGIAVHGAASIPGQPASHGCARVSRAAMDLLWSSGSAPLGTEVRVY